MSDALDELKTLAMNGSGMNIVTRDHVLALVEKAKAERFGEDVEEANPYGVTPMDAKRIAELRRVAEAATPGPWRVSWFPVDTVTGEGGDYVVEAGDINGHAEELICYGDWDGDFIAAARTAVPELLAEVERLIARVRKLADGLDQGGSSEVAIANEPRRAIEGGGEAS